MCNPDLRYLMGNKLWCVITCYRETKWVRSHRIKDPKTVCGKDREKVEIM